MEPKCSCGASSSEFEFGFAFDDSNFSDRVLRIEIMTDPVDAPPPPPPNSDSVTAVVRPCKRRRKNVLDLTEQILDVNELDMDNQEDDTVEECDESANNNDSNSVARVNTLHISSLILAVRSPFFHKLLTNGMRESEQRHITIKINASEESALMELLNFMYRNTLNTTALSAPALLDVLIVADKFGVSSCMTYCSNLLLNTPMTPESALLYLELPHTVTMADVVRPLTDAAKKYLAGRYKDITKFEDEVMALPLSGIEAILANDDLEVTSEDVVYDFVLKWARQHYNKPEERREVLGTRLARLIRFPYMTCPKLEEVLTCNDFKHNGTSELVLTSLIFKAMPQHCQRQRLMAAKLSGSLDSCCFVERAYKYRPVKVVEFELPWQQCVVYLDLKREECATLFPSGKVSCQTFHLGGQGFYLSAQCNMDSYHCFGLFLAMSSSSVSLDVHYEFSVRSRTTKDFVSKFKCNHKFSKGDTFGRKNLFKIPWTSFMAENSHFFINGVLHLRAELTIKH